MPSRGPKGSDWWVHWDDIFPVPPQTPTVEDAQEPTHSSILGPDGEPLRYASKRQNHVGFVALKER